MTRVRVSSNEEAVARRQPLLSLLSWNDNAAINSTAEELGQSWTDTMDVGYEMRWPASIRYPVPVSLESPVLLWLSHVG